MELHTINTARGMRALPSLVLPERLQHRKLSTERATHRDQVLALAGKIRTAARVLTGNPAAYGEDFYMCFVKHLYALTSLASGRVDPTLRWHARLALIELDEMDD